MRSRHGPNGRTTVPVSPGPVIAVSTVAIGLGAAIGFHFGFIATLLMGDLGLSRGSVGLLTSIYFGSTGLGSVAGGAVADRLGARWAVALDLLLVTVGAGAIALHPTYTTLVIGSIVAGAGYALSNAGTNVAIAATIPPSRRTLAMTIKTAGVPGMGVVGAFVAPWAGARHGWPVVLAAIAVLALLGMVATLVWLPPDRPTIASDRRQAVPLPRGFLWFPVGAFFLLTGSQPLFSWIVPYFEESVGMSVAAAGRASSLATALGLVIMLTVARGADRLGPRRRVRTMVVLVLGAASGVVVAASGTWLGAAVGIVGTFVAMGCQLGVIGNLHAAVVERAPAAVGRASGVTMTGYYFGALVAPVGFGTLVDLTGAYTLPWGVMVLALLAAAVSFWAGGRVVGPATSGLSGTRPVSVPTDS